MTKYFCPYCKKFLLNSNYKIVKTHFNGQKHLNNRKNYYKNLLKNDEVKKCLEKLRKYKPFKLPNVDISKIRIPEMPDNFKLPREFDYEDRANYPDDYNDWELFLH